MMKITKFILPVILISNVCFANIVTLPFGKNKPDDIVIYGANYEYFFWEPLEDYLDLWQPVDCGDASVLNDAADFPVGYRYELFEFIVNNVDFNTTETFEDNDPVVLTNGQLAGGPEYNLWQKIEPGQGQIVIPVSDIFTDSHNRIMSTWCDGNFSAVAPVYQLEWSRITGVGYGAMVRHRNAEGRIGCHLVEQGQHDLWADWDGSFTVNGGRLTYELSNRRFTLGYDNHGSGAFGPNEIEPPLNKLHTLPPPRMYYGYENQSTQTLELILPENYPDVILDYDIQNPRVTNVPFYRTVNGELEVYDARRNLHPDYQLIEVGPRPSDVFWHPFWEAAGLTLNEPLQFQIWYSHVLSYQWRLDMDGDFDLDQDDIDIAASLNLPHRNDHVGWMEGLINDGDCGEYCLLTIFLQSITPIDNCNAVLGGGGNGSVTKNSLSNYMNMLEGMSRPTK